MRGERAKNGAMHARTETARRRQRRYTRERERRVGDELRRHDGEPKTRHARERQRAYDRRFGDGSRNNRLRIRSVSTKSSFATAPAMMFHAESCFFSLRFQIPRYHVDGARCRAARAVSPQTARPPSEGRATVAFGGNRFRVVTNRQ